MKTLLAVTLLLSFASVSFAEVRTARIFDIGKTSGEPRFTQETSIETSPTDEKSWSSKIKDAKGDVVMTEKATINGDRVTYQYVEQLQLKEAYELKVEGDKATFNTFKIVDGKKGETIETKTIGIDKDFLTGPATEFYLKKKWQDLLDAKTVKVDFGIFELSRSVGFSFKKIKDLENSIELEMKPSNFFISVLVTPLVMEFDKKEKRMIRFKGRTPLREFIDGKWKPLDAEILYP